MDLNLSPVFYMQVCVVGVRVNWSKKVSWLTRLLPAVHMGMTARNTVYRFISVNSLILGACSPIWHQAVNALG